MNDNSQSAYPKGARYLKLQMLLERCEGRILLQDGFKRDLGDKAQRAAIFIGVMVGVGIGLLTLAMPLIAERNETLNIVAQWAFGGLLLSSAVVGVIAFWIARSKDWYFGANLAEAINTLDDDTPEDVLEALLNASSESTEGNDEILEKKGRLFSYLSWGIYASLFFLLMFAGSLYVQFLHYA